MDEVQLTRLHLFKGGVDPFSKGIGISHGVTDFCKFLSII